MQRTVAIGVIPKPESEGAVEQDRTMRPAD